MGGHYDELAKGSELHIAQFSGDRLRILPKDDTVEGRVAFDAIVDEAIHYGESEGFKVIPQPDLSGNFRYSMAVIVFDV